MVAREMFKVDCLRNNLKVEKCIKKWGKTPLKRILLGHKL